MIKNCNRSGYGACALVLLALGLSASACGSGSGSSSAESAANTGSIDLALNGPDNVIFRTVSYQVTTDFGFFTQGAIDVTDSEQVSAVIGGIPVGTGYRIKLSATTVGATCTGSASGIEVVAGKTSGVIILLSCQVPSRTGTVRIEGRINICPTIDNFSITPGETTVGHTISLTASGNDIDSGPSPLTYKWTTTLGEIADPTSPNTTLDCTEAGAAHVTLAVSDGDDGCATQQIQVVECDEDTRNGSASLCGNGQIDPGEVCDDENRVSGDGCSADCQLDDSLVTPGDDRPGYVLCSNFDNVSGIVCGPGTFCCQQTESCVVPGSDPGTFCSVPYLQQTCDGPEDCSTGYVCQRYRATMCVASGQGPTSYLCHTDSECPVGWSCDVDGHCDSDN